MASALFSHVSGSTSGRAGRCQRTRRTCASSAPPRLAASAPAGLAAPQEAQLRGSPALPRPRPARAPGAAVVPSATPPAERPLLSDAPEPGSYQRTLRGAGHQQQLAVRLPGAPEKGIGTLSRRGAPTLPSVSALPC